MQKIVATIQPNDRITNPLPNDLNIERQIERCPSTIGYAVSKRITRQDRDTQSQAQTQTGAMPDIKSSFVVCKPIT